MNKIIAFGLVGIVSATAANAGLMDMLGIGKKKEPATLEEACNKDDITKICPEIILGTKTMAECLTENVSSLSKQCANFVKKSATDKIDSAKAAIVGAPDSAKGAAADKTDSAKAAAAEKTDAVKSAIQEKTDAAKAAAAEQKAAADAKKEAAAATGKEVSDSVKETGDALKETGNSLKGLFGK